MTCASCPAEGTVFLRAPNALPKWYCSPCWRLALHEIAASYRSRATVVRGSGDDLDYWTRLLMARSREALTKGGTCACGAKGVALWNAEQWECLRCLRAAARPETPSPTLRAPSQRAARFRPRSRRAS
jgi:hypothetical protein